MFIGYPLPYRDQVDALDHRSLPPSLHAAASTGVTDTYHLLNLGYLLRHPHTTYQCPHYYSPSVISFVYSERQLITKTSCFLLISMINTIFLCQWIPLSPLYLLFTSGTSKTLSLPLISMTNTIFPHSQMFSQHL